jgi:hypothetical protein
MITDDDFIHLPELYLKFGDLKKYLDNLYNLKIYTMNYEELAKKNVWGLEAEDIKTIEEDGFFDGGGHWIFNNVDGSYEAVYDGNYMHVFGSLEDLMARENEIAYYEYSPELSEENGEETFVNAKGKVREYKNGGGVKKRSLMSVAHLVDWKGEGIKKWYIRSYPTDDLGEELNDEATFTDLWNGIHNKENVYDIMGVGDSVIRERLFEYLSLIYDVEYSYVYNKWLESADYANGGGIKNENREMLMNNNKQIKHHTTELSSAIKKSKHIPAWVVSKMGRSTSDISDITHYLDGQAANGKRIRKPLYAIMMGKYSQFDNPQYVEVSSEDMNEAMMKFKAMGVDAVPSSIHFSKQPPYYYNNGGNVGRDAMFRSQEPHEQRYNRKREWKEYKKDNWLANDWFANGGGVDGVIVYDNDGETLDRYTIFTPDGSVYGMSDNALMPNGFNQYLGDNTEVEKGSHLGKKLKSIPESIKVAVQRRMSEYANGGGVPDYINKTKEQIWNNWTKEQRIHFIKDHDKQSRYNAEEQADFDYDDIHDTNISDWIGEHIEMGQYKNGGGIGVEYNYEILAKNTLTGEENVVCQVRMFGDVPHIIKGLQNAVGSSPIKYIHKNIENKAAQGMFLEGEFEEIVAKTKAYVDKYPYVWTKGNKSYVPIEGWQYAASLMGLSARVSEVTPMPEKNGWMAKAEVVNQNGVVVCSGFGFVGRDEPKWANAPETDLEAFAQTKAVSRALRNCISYLIKAAGYSTTPAEEMYGIKTPKKSGVKPFVSKTTEEDFIFDKPEYKFPEEQKVSSVFARSTQPPIVKAEKKDEGKFYALLKEMYHNAVSTGITIKSKEFMEEIDATLFAHGDTEEDYRLMIADGFSWLLDNGFVLKSRIFMNKIRSAIAYARLD